MQKLFFFLSLLGLLCACPTWAQTGTNVSTDAAVSPDSIQQQLATTPSVDPATDDFTPMLSAMAVLALVAVLLGLGGGIVLAIAALAVIAGLFGLGITTSAVIVGLWRRSWVAGLRTLFWLLMTIGGAGAGAIGIAGINYIVNITFVKDALVLGGIIGLIIGGFAAYTSLRIMGLAVTIWQRRLSAASGGLA